MHPKMELQYDDKNSDLVFAFRYIFNAIKITKSDNGLTLIYNEEKFTGLAQIFDRLQNTEYREYMPKNTLKEVNEIKNKALKQIFKNIDKNEKTDCLTFSKVFLYTRIYRGIKEFNSYSEAEIRYFENLQTKIEEKTAVKRIEYFDCFDIRVGKIIDVKEHPNADGLYVETVLIDENGKTLNILSGLRKYVAVDELLNQKFLFLTNMKKAKLRGIDSEGMILCIKNENTLEVIKVTDNVKEGTKVRMENKNEAGIDVLLDIKECLLDAKSDFFSNIMKPLQANNNEMVYGSQRLTINGKIISTITQNGQIN